MSQGRLQSNVWEDLINSGEYLSCLARRGRNGREERIDSQQKNQVRSQEFLQGKQPCQDRKRAEARGWQLNLEMVRKGK